MAKITIPILIVFLLIGTILSHECPHGGDCEYTSKCDVSDTCAQPNVCSNLIFTASGTGFTSTDIMRMKKYFENNINIEGKGGVVASPDTNTPGGSYYYAWTRDSALSMKSFMIINDFSLEKIRTNMDAYIQWILRVHKQPNPHKVDNRVEVKFFLPNGEPFDGPWCRPQTDGPGLEAATLVMYAQKLIEAGEVNEAKKYLWTGSSDIYNGGIIKYDLDWVVENWRSNGCDLWEEIENEDFFWGRFNFRNGLLRGAELAEQLGDKESSLKYRQTAKNIQDTLANHWTGNYIYESKNRPKDSSVISAFNDGYADDGYFKPTDWQVASTIATLNDLFCHEYLINQIDTRNKIPGILYGRYEGDIYAGGNPWVLLSADLAKLFYRASFSIVQEIKQGNKAINDIEILAWINAMNLQTDSHLYWGKDRDIKLAEAMLKAGDSVLQRIYSHVNEDQGHLNEQIDRENGKQIAAKDLTWSYAVTLVALKTREKLIAEFSQYKTF